MSQEPNVKWRYAGSFFTRVEHALLGIICSIIVWNHRVLVILCCVWKIIDSILLYPYAYAISVMRHVCQKTTLL